MDTLLTYNITHYITAKTILIDAMEKNKVIYLLGSGGNGKSHLINEIIDKIKEKKYRIYHEVNEQSRKLRKSIICVNRYMDIENVSDNTIIINMNKIKATIFST